MVHHLLNVRDRRIGAFHRACEHLLRNADRLVEVHGGVHEAPRDEHSLQRREAFAVQRELASMGPERLQEPREVDRPMGGTGVVRVPHEVVNLIRVHRAVDDLRQVSLGFLPTPRHEQARASVRGPANQRGDGLRIHRMLLEDLVDPLDVREGAPVLRGNVVVVTGDDPLGEVHVID